MRVRFSYGNSSKNFNKFYVCALYRKLPVHQRSQIEPSGKCVASSCPLQSWMMMLLFFIIFSSATSFLAFSLVITTSTHVASYAHAMFDHNAGTHIFFASSRFFLESPFCWYFPIAPPRSFSCNERNFRVFFLKKIRSKAWGIKCTKIHRVIFGVKCLEEQSIARDRFLDINLTTHILTFLRIICTKKRLEKFPEYNVWRNNQLFVINLYNVLRNSCLFLKTICSVPRDITCLSKSKKLFLNTCYV